MHAFAALALLLVSHLALVRASVYVTNPVQSSVLTAGQAFTVTWVDDGESPTLSSIGECTVSLYTGELQLVQSLSSVDVATASSLTFTPDASVGADGQYYIVFTSTSTTYQGFSASFTLTGMTGTTPSGGSSAPVSASATTSASSSTSAGSSLPATTGSTTATGSSVSTPSGTTAATGTTSPTLTTPTASSTVTASTVTPTTTATATLTSASASASATNAAVRVGSSASFGGAAALLVLSGVLAF